MSHSLVRVSRAFISVLVSSLALALLLPVAAWAVAPVSTLTYDPAAPDGNNGWWVTNPLVSITSDQTGTAHWSWDLGAESTAAVTAGVPWVVGIAPDGTHRITAWSENTAAEVESPRVVATLSSDPTPPDQVTGVTGTVAAALGIDLTWTPTTDAISGVGAYIVYRSTSLDFSAADLVGSTTGTSFRDVPPASGGYFWYAVAAVDVAGNESVLSEPVLFASDFTPPTTPGDLQAWRNASGFARVSWTPSTDIGFGLDHYDILRSVGGGAFSLAGTASPDAIFFDDHDASVQGPGPVDYKVVAVDGAGLGSREAGPARMGIDTLPPAAPLAVARPVFDPPGGGSAFALAWAQSPLPAGSGIARYDVFALPAGGTTATVTLFGLPPVRATVVATAAPSALYSFRMQSTDRAGNVSAPSGAVGARNVTVRRTAGVDRYETAIALSASTFTTSGAVVVASGLVYPDALAGSGLAGALHAPILLVPTGPAPASVLAEVARLRATRVYVVGGSATVGTDTAASLALPGVEVIRVAGIDRYETAAAVARTISAITGAPARRAYVVSGRVFSDALSVGSAAYAEACPVLFATRWSVPVSTIDALAASGATQTVIVGGTGSVTPAAERILPGPVRIAGIDRYAVSRAFATWAIGNGILGCSEPAVASGRVFSDGLSAAPFAGERRSPLLLANPFNPLPLGQWLFARRAGLSTVNVAGGSATVPDWYRRYLWARVSLP